MNLLSLQQECGRLLSDPQNDRWSASLLTTRINLAAAEIQGLTNAVKTSEAVTPVASTRTISVNANTMNILRATKTLSDGTTIRPFPGKNVEELDYLYPDWQQWQTGEPLYWFFDATNQQINLVPKPDAANAITNGITMWESRKPADLSTSTDIPFDSNTAMIPYHYSIVHWVVAHCWMDNGDPESLAKATFHRSGSMLRPGQYELEIGRILAEFDIEEAIPEQILWKPQGGRVGGWSFPSKSNPIPW